jgi:transcriptional regulator with XRE-family HTH domain
MTGNDEVQRRETADIVMYWMRRRGMTRKIFGDRMGKSLSWVDKIRAGDRQLDRVSVLRQIARVLDIPLVVLIDPDEAERQRTCPDDGEIDDVRRALCRYDVTTNVFRPPDDPLMQAGGRVIEAAESIPRVDLMRLPRERRASHVLDLARGYLQAGQRDEAATALLEADQIAPGEVRCRDLTRSVIIDLVHSYPRGAAPATGIMRLARAAGVTI